MNDFEVKEGRVAIVTTTHLDFSLVLELEKFEVKLERVMISRHSEILLCERKALVYLPDLF